MTRDYYRRHHYPAPPSDPRSYSNWRGPVWINVNCVLAYTLAANGYRAEAAALARDITRTLADDLRANGQWHECYCHGTSWARTSPRASPRGATRCGWRSDNSA